MPFLITKMAKSQPKICFVLTAEFAVKAFLLNHLRALSKVYDVTVIVNTSNLNFLEKYGVKAKVIPLAIARDINLISDFSCLFQLIKIFRQQNFSAVHSVTPKAGLLAMLASWLACVPLRVHTFTGQVWVTKTGVKRLLLKQFDRLIALFSTQIIVDSPSQCQFLIDENVIAIEKSNVFAKGSISGVDLVRFKFNQQTRVAIRQQLDIPNEAIVFLFVGRLTKDKGVLDLAQAWRDAHLNNAHLIYAGPDEQNMQIQIARLVETDKMNIYFIGHTNTPEDYMSAADVLCLPSYREGFGSVIIEAAAVGIPAIASRIYGITDAVVDNETGLLHTSGDIDAINNCLQNMLGSSTLRLKLGQKAQVRAVEDFDSHLITRAWVDFYRKNLP
jgi:glycosyltransferase involved in cell wall biosynthesis